MCSQLNYVVASCRYALAYEEIGVASQNYCISPESMYYYVFLDSFT